MPIPSLPERSQALADLTQGPWDLAVVGGGIVGAACAWEAARQGLRVVLVEAKDFAQGASSRSSKLLHGGVRYLEQGEVGLVFESIAQRDRLMLDAPHLAWELPFLFPIPAKKPWLRPYIGAGLALYDALAWAARRGLGAFRHWLGRAALAQREAKLDASRLAGAYRYLDGGTDDARMVLEALREASEAGAWCLNHLEVQAFERGPGGEVVGLELHDALGQRPWRLKAKATLVACGPSTDLLLKALDPAAKPMLRPTKGIHLLLAPLLVEHAVVIESKDPKERRPRVMFAIPWLGRTLVGTTDTDVAPQDDPCLAPSQDLEASAEEVAYVLAATNQAFGTQLGPQEVLAAFAGWRPLLAPAAPGQGAGAISREHHLWAPAPGLWAIAGGKLTSFRTMGAQAIALLRSAQAWGPAPGPSAGPLSIEQAKMGGPGWLGEGLEAHVAAAPQAMPELAPDLARHLARRHGGRWAELRAWAARPGGARLLGPLPPPYCLCAAEVWHHMAAEGACEVADVLLRRTRLGWLLEDQGLGLAPEVAEVMARWWLEQGACSPEEAAAWRAASLEAYRQGVARMMAFRAQGPSDPPKAPALG